MYSIRQKTLDKHPKVVIQSQMKGDSKMAKYVIIGGGWSGCSKTGDPFVRLKFQSAIPENTMVTMWKNKRKATDRHPDYIVLAYVKEETAPKSHPNEFF
jgi:uncharacterized protein (DUF736 family)